MWISFYRASWVALVVKNLPANAGDARDVGLGQEDALEEGMATHSSILAWRIPWTDEPARLQGRKELDTTEHLSTSLYKGIYEAFFTSKL